MEKIKIARQYKKPARNERVVIWVSKDIRDALARVSEETGLSQQCLADLLLQKAMDAIEIVDSDI